MVAAMSGGTMTMAASDLTAAPFVAFNFSVEITIDGDAPLCAASFSECDGLEMNQEVKTIREGGNNGVQVRHISSVWWPPQERLGYSAVAPGYDRLVADLPPP